MLVGGSASGAGYASSQQGDVARGGVTGSALLVPRIGDSLDNGWEFRLNAALLLWHDALSGDNYGNRFFEKDWLSLQTQYGRVELGQQDGAAYALSTTGPKLDEAVAIDMAQTTFFRDPTTGRAFVDIFPIRTGEFASENFAKVSYYSPRLFGFAVAGSYTPTAAQDGLPFASRGPQVSDRQTNLLEAAASYETDLGPVSAQSYAGIVVAHDAGRTPGHADLLDWAAGASFDTDIDGAKLSFGGGFRQSSAYTFAIDKSFTHGATQSLRLSGTMTEGPWIAGLEFSDAIAAHEANLPRLHQTGYEPSLGYVVNSNLQLTLGWQHLNFTRDTGIFYDGRPGARMDAVFLHAQFHV